MQIGPLSFLTNCLLWFLSENFPRFLDCAVCNAIPSHQTSTGSRTRCAWLPVRTMAPATLSRSDWQSRVRVETSTPSPRTAWPREAHPREPVPRDSVSAAISSESSLGLCLKFGGILKLLFQNSITYFLVNQSLIWKLPDGHNSFCYHVLKGNS